MAISLALYLLAPAEGWLADLRNVLVPAGLLLQAVLSAAQLSRLSRPSRAYRKALLALTQSEDRAAVGPLLEALHGPRILPDPLLQSALFGALARLLPYLHMDDAGHLTERQKSSLRRLLRDSDSPPDLILAAILAVGQMEMVSARSAIERLARGRAATPAERRVHDAAVYCLATLEISRGEEAAGSGLLRASLPPANQAVELLRPFRSESADDSGGLSRKLK